MWLVDDAYKRALQELLSDRIRFVVPPFQRNYVWTRDKWSRLWEDVLETAGRTSQIDHFLGAIVLQHAPERAGDPKIREVVDGQQRLTTVQLLLAAIGDVAGAHSQPEVTERIRELTQNRAAEPSHEYKVTPSLADLEAFRSVISAGGAAALRKLYPTAKDEPPIVQAYNYFAEQVSGYVRSPKAARDALASLVDALGRGVCLVVIELNEKDDPQAVYERLNSGGAVLRASELVRNHIFHQCVRQGLNQRQMYDDYWEGFDDGYWFDSDSTSAPTRLDNFLRAYLVMQTHRSVETGKLFAEFRSYLATRDGRLPDTLASIARYGEIFASIDTGDGLDEYERDFADRLKAIDSSVLMPVLLQLFGGYDAARRGPAIRVLESYLLRRTICGLDASSHADRVVPLLRLLTADVDPATAVREHLAGVEGKGHWPTDEQVRQAVVTRPIYDRRRRHLVNMLVMLAERQLHTDRTEQTRYEADKLTIEHLMPQAWEQHWPIEQKDPKRRGQERTERNELIHTLGNLTLITERLNTEVANGPWARKREQIDKYSNLRLNKQLPVTFGAAAAIRQRGEQLAQLLCAALAAPPPPAPSGRGRRPAPPVEVAVSSETTEEEVSPLGEDEPPEASTPRRRSGLGTQIRNVLGTADGPLTYLEIADAVAAANPDNGAPARTVRYLLSSWSVSGVRTTTKDGKIAGVLKARKRPKGAGGA